MGSKGSPLDNAVAESFFATFKKDLIKRRSWPTKGEARVAIFEWIEVFYNRILCTRRSGATLPPSSRACGSRRQRKRLESKPETVHRNGSGPGMHNRLGRRSRLARTTPLLPRLLKRRRDSATQHKTFAFWDSFREGVGIGARGKRCPIGAHPASVSARLRFARDSKTACQSYKPNAAERTRTSTAREGHKALNLAERGPLGSLPLVQAVSGPLRCSHFRSVWYPVWYPGRRRARPSPPRARTGRSRRRSESS